MGRINNDLKKQGLEIRREGNRIQLVGIETTAETADKRIKANLAIAEKRIISGPFPTISLIGISDGMPYLSNGKNVALPQSAKTGILYFFPSLTISSNDTSLV